MQLDIVIEGERTKHPDDRGLDVGRQFQAAIKSDPSNVDVLPVDFLLASAGLSVLLAGGRYFAASPLSMRAHGSLPRLKVLIEPIIRSRVIAAIPVVRQEKFENHGGVVAVTDDEFVLIVPGPFYDRKKIRVASRLPRSTPIPSSGSLFSTPGRGAIAFAVGEMVEEWAYNTPLLEYRELIDELAADSKVRFAALNRSAPMSLARGPAPGDLRNRLLTSAGYLASVREFHHLAPELVVGAVPLRTQPRAHQTTSRPRTRI